MDHDKFALSRLHDDLKESINREGFSITMDKPQKEALFRLLSAMKQRGELYNVDEIKKQFDERFGMDR